MDHPVAADQTRLPPITLINPMATITSASSPRTIRYLGMAMFSHLFDSGADRPLQWATFAQTGDDSRHDRQRREEECCDGEGMSH